MKKLAILAIAILATSTLAFAYAGSLDYFTAKTDGDGISLEWKSGIETGIKSYSIERSDIKSNDFSEIGEVNATGNNSYYKFHDSHVSAASAAGAVGYKPDTPVDIGVQNFVEWYLQYHH